MKPGLYAAMLVAALSLAPAHAAPVTIRHAQGETQVEVPVGKALILDVNALDIADALGVRPMGGLGTNLPPWMGPDFPPPDYVVAGTIFEPDYEAIAAAEADLMIVGTRSARALPELSRILPTIDLSLTGAHFDAVRRNIAIVAQLFGVPERGAALVADLDARLAALRAVTPGAGTALILVTNGGKLGAYGPASRLGWIHSDLGFAPVEADIDDRFHGGDVISFEYILDRDPDWIFVVDRDAGVGNAGEGAQAVLDNALMAQTSAMRNGRVVQLDPYAAYIAFGGYTAMTRLLDQITAALAAAG